MKKSPLAKMKKRGVFLMEKGLGKKKKNWKKKKKNNRKGRREKKKVIWIGGQIGSFVKLMKNSLEKKKI